MKTHTIEQVLTMTEEDIFRAAALIPCNKRTYKPEHFMYIDNGAPVCLVAHVDTLKRHGIEPMTCRNVMINRLGLLGADDRAGVYAALKLAHTGCNILLTDYEEQGGIGAQAAAQELQFPGVRLFIELDRQGCNDYVYYSQTLPQAIKRYVESYGFVESYGSYSDISELEDFRIPAVNLSIGYYKQHTSKERLHLDEMELTIARVKSMIASPPDKLHKVRKYTERWDSRDDLSWL